uniref:Uncharacterized protein n=1 Tax=Arundo donax TaxID=35708 RepID=A0A0A8YB97_ARUDO
MITKIKKEKMGLGNNITMRQGGTNRRPIPCNGL